jgi:hypothetical protein
MSLSFRLDQKPIAAKPSESSAQAIELGMSLAIDAKANTTERLMKTNW